MICGILSNCCNAGVLQMMDGDYCKECLEKCEWHLVSTKEGLFEKVDRKYGLMNGK